MCNHSCDMGVGELTPTLHVRLVTLAFSRVNSILSLQSDDSLFPIGLNNLAVKLESDVDSCFYK